VSTQPPEQDVVAVGRDLAAALPRGSRNPVRALDDKAMDLAAQDAELRAALFRFVDAGASQRAPRRAASSRLPRSMSETASCAPSRASRVASRRPTWPRPTTAIERPFRSGEPNARSHVAWIACRTPSAVNGLGSPDPPRRRLRPLTCAVARAIVVMSRADVPTSSAVM
jgi:hypothetical protein